jgi:hypothetical protein
VSDLLIQAFALGRFGLFFETELCRRGIRSLDKLRWPTEIQCVITPWKAAN